MTDLSGKTPKVTVITSVYNSEPYLADCLDSLLTQTFTNFEVLLIDDGSTDDSNTIYTSYAAIDKRLRVIRFSSNHGVGYCRAVSLHRARGEYVAVLDSDNIAAPYRLQLQADWLDSHLRTVLVASHFGIINKQSKLIGAEELALSETEIRWRLIFGNCLCHSTVMFRRQAAIKCGGYAPDIVAGEDLDLYSRLACLGTIAIIPEQLALWRSHENSLTKSEKNSRLIPLYVQIVAHSIERHLWQKVSPATAFTLFNNIGSPAPDIDAFSEAVKVTLIASEVLKHNPYVAASDHILIERCTLTQLMDLQYRNKHEPWWEQAVSLWKRALLYLFSKQGYNWPEDITLVWPDYWISKNSLAALLGNSLLV